MFCNVESRSPFSCKPAEMVLSAAGSNVRQIHTSRRTCGRAIGWFRNKGCRVDERSKTRDSVTSKFDFVVSRVPNLKKRGPLATRAFSTANPPEEPEVEERAKLRLTETAVGASAVWALGVVLWFGGNIWFNVLNKQVLKVFLYPFTCTCIYLAVSGLAGVAGWASGLVKKPKVTKKQLIAFIPLAICHLLSNVLIMVSLGNVPVSFTHTIKACEPFVMVVTSALILGFRPPKRLVFSLVPVVLGVSIASATELNFNWIGFNAAMASNVASALRNVYTKAHLGDSRGDLSSYDLLAIVSLMACVMMFPLALFMEGAALTPSAVASLGLEWGPTVQKIVTAGAIMTLYQQISYNILSRVSPVTHSVMNTIKRVAVIVASVLVFQNPVSVTNAVGTAIALVGVLLYSLVKRWISVNEVETVKT